MRTCRRASVACREGEGGAARDMRCEWVRKLCRWIVIHCWCRAELLVAGPALIPSLDTAPLRHLSRARRSATSATTLPARATCVPRQRTAPSCAAGIPAQTTSASVPPARTRISPPPPHTASSTKSTTRALWQGVSKARVWSRAARFRLVAFLYPPPPPPIFIHAALRHGHDALAMTDDVYAVRSCE